MFATLFFSLVTPVLAGAEFASCSFLLAGFVVSQMCLFTTGIHPKLRVCRDVTHHCRSGVGLVSVCWPSFGPLTLCKISLLSQPMMTMVTAIARHDDDQR